MSWGVFPDRRTGQSSLLDPLLESSLLDPLWSHHLTLAGVFFAQPSLEPSLLDPPLESSRLSLSVSYLQLAVSRSDRRGLEALLVYLCPGCVPFCPSSVPSG
jgi:hypothetical protein